MPSPVNTPNHSVVTNAGRISLEKNLGCIRRNQGKRLPLKAIIELRKEGKWDRAFGGATWTDMLTKIRENGGVYPPPRDLAILKSYKIYLDWEQKVSGAYYTGRDYSYRGRGA